MVLALVLAIFVVVFVFAGFPKIRRRMVGVTEAADVGGGSGGV